ncbi:Hypothetical predicted protein [Paramuricea clavata]|uniref:Uncharacterized protein n=1 Tax=Paramuricea clavata TaxID=317549 RepID=A0A6S7HJV8_PARCT|nr:Hypothetical predicted protein [Paramuricea clavata]
MGPFRWPMLQNDVDLAKEVVATRPEKPSDWDNIASRLNPIFSLTNGKAVVLKGRSCRERMERLLKKYKADDSAALKRSGTEEEYSELNVLLEDITVFRRDLEEARELEKEVKRKKIEEDEKRGHDMRQAALSGIAGLDEDEDEEDNPPEEKNKTGKKVKQRASKLSAVQMLSDKYERKAELKQKELEIRKMELDLQKRKFEEQTEERKMRFKMEMEERRMMLELLNNKM